MDINIVNLLKYPSCDGITNLEILNYVNHLVQSQSALPMCFQVLYNQQNENDDFAKFIALQIIDKHYETFHDTELHCFHALLNLIQSAAKQEFQFPQFILNSVIYISSKIFAANYAANINLFDSLLVLLTIQPNGITIFLRHIDEINRLIITTVSTTLNPPPLEGAANNITVETIENLKKALRAHASTKIFDSLCTIIQLFIKTQDSISQQGISVFSSLIGWNDISLTFTPSITKLLSLCFSIDSLVDNVSDCFGEYVVKGMTMESKTKIIHQILIIVLDHRDFETRLWCRISVISLLDKSVCHLFELYIKYFRTAAIQFQDTANLSDRVMKLVVRLFILPNDKYICHVTNVINEYLSLYRKYSILVDIELVNAIKEATIIKSQHFVNLSKSINTPARKNLKSIIINIYKNVHSEFGIHMTTTFVDIIYQSNVTQSLLCSSIKILSLIPRLFSNAFFSKFDSMNIVPNVIRFILDSSNNEMYRNVKIQKYILDVINGYKFIYCKSKETYDRVISFLLDKYSRCDEQECIREYVVDSILKCIRSHPNISNVYYAQIFAHFSHNVLLVFESSDDSYVRIPSSSFTILAHICMSEYTHDSFQIVFNQIFNILLHKFNTIASRLISVECASRGKDLDDSQLNSLQSLHNFINYLARGVAYHRKIDTPIVSEFYSTLLVTYWSVLVNFPNCSELLQLSFSGLNRILSVSNPEHIRFIINFLLYIKDSVEIPSILFFEFIFKFMSDFRKENTNTMLELFPTISDFFVCYLGRTFKSECQIDHKTIISCRMMSFKILQICLTFTHPHLLIIGDILLSLNRFVADCIMNETDYEVLDCAIVVFQQVVDQMMEITNHDDDYYRTYIICPCLNILGYKMIVDNGRVKPNKATSVITAIFVALIQQDKIQLIISLYPTFGNIQLLQPIFQLVSQISSQSAHASLFTHIHKCIIQLYIPPKINVIG